METLDFAIQPCQYKFTFWKVRANRNFQEFIRFFQTGCSLFKSSFAVRNCNSIFVLNLNLFPKGKLFLIFHSIRLKSLVNCRAHEGWFS
jgi:hypothetical protein